MNNKTISFYRIHKHFIVFVIFALLFPCGCSKDETASEVLIKPASKLRKIYSEDGTAMIQIEAALILAKKFNKRVLLKLVLINADHVIDYMTFSSMNTK